jgi:hypothetical protein
MITTVLAPSRKMMGVGIFEAIKFGVEFERLNDTTIEFSSAKEERIDLIVNKMCGTVLSSVNQVDIHPYGGE